MAAYNNTRSVKLYSSDRKLYRLLKASGEPSVRTIILTAFYAGRTTPHHYMLSIPLDVGETETVIGRYKFRFRFTAVEAVFYRDFIATLRNMTGSAVLSLFKQGVNMLGIDIDEAIVQLESQPDNSRTHATAGACKTVPHAPHQNTVLPAPAAPEDSPPNHEVEELRIQSVITQSAMDDPKPVADYTTHSGIIKKYSSTEPVPSVPSSSHVAASAASKPAPLDDSVMDSIVGDFLDDL